MAKRFTDTEKWKKYWFRTLSNDHKVFWFYLLDNCDHAGIWEVDFELADYFCKGVNEQEIRSVFKKQFIEFDNKKRWFIKDFLDFQYGDLKETNRMHKSVITRLQKHNLIKYMGHISPLDGAKEKEQVQDKDKVKEKIKKREEKFCLEAYSFVDSKGYDKLEIGKFINFWTEKNKSGSKMKFEMQQTFDISRRLARWMSNIKEWKIDKPKQTEQFKKAKSGLFIAYCQKCGSKNYPNEYQLKQQSCCGVDFLPSKPEPDKHNQPELDAKIIAKVFN